MEPGTDELSKPRNNETKKTVSDISKHFNTFHVPKGIIQYFGLSPEDVKRILKDHEVLGASYWSRYPSAQDQKLLQFALNEGSSATNFIGFNKEGQPILSDEQILAEKVISKVGLEKILKIDSIDELLKSLGENIVYGKRLFQEVTKEQVEELADKVLIKEPLYDISLISKDKNTIEVIKNLSEETIKIWEDMGTSIFGKKKSDKFLILRSKEETILPKEALDKLDAYGFMALRSLASKLEELPEAVYNFAVDEKTNQYLTRIAWTAGDAKHKSYKGLVEKDKRINLLNIQIGLLLNPYLREIKTSEDYRKFVFTKHNGEISNKILMQTVDLCKRILKTEDLVEPPDYYLNTSSLK